MALNTEPGDEAADAYVTVEECAAYAAARGSVFAASPADLAEQAIRRATAWIDATYRLRFTGCPTDIWQSLEWPRKDVVYRGTVVDDDLIPKQIKDACCEAAIREFSEPNSLAPDLERGGAIKTLKAGSVEIDYADSAPAATTFTAIDGILSGLLTAASNTSFLKRA